MAAARDTKAKCPIFECFNDRESGEVLCSEHIESLSDLYFDFDPYMDLIPSDYWMAPDGTCFGHDSDTGSHELTAYLLGFEGIPECERAGYLHIEFQAYILNVRPRITDAQAETLLYICNNGALHYPVELVQYVRDQDVVSMVNHNLRPHWSIYVTYLPAAIRKQTHRLSGD